MSLCSSLQCQLSTPGLFVMLGLIVVSDPDIYAGNCRFIDETGEDDEEDGDANHI